MTVQARLTLYREGKKVFETQPVRAGKPLPSRPGALPVWINTPLKSVAPGKYECQVSVIDQFGRKFAFERTVVAVVPGTANTGA
jgi:hypothetical protein